MNLRLKKIREIRGITQADLANRLGVDVSTVFTWEKGTNEIPQAKILLICELFEINKNWLLTGEGSPTAPNIKSDLYKTIQDRLCAIRNHFNLNQKKLAQFLDLSESAFAYWEKNNKIPPKKARLICERFGVSEEWLVNGEGEMLDSESTSSDAFSLDKIDANETVKSFALRHGCDELTAKLFERFMGLNSHEKQCFIKILMRITNPEGGTAEGDVSLKNDKSGTSITIHGGLNANESIFNF